LTDEKSDITEMTRRSNLQ